ncbi:S-Ena type endospore appendage [Gottfriedia acidiceleris]|uniref:S-Ena type endospore appendage n=1 Tax=Bacillaceae TaxID=186817 RepID=UPI000BEBE2C2|nr:MULTISPECIES: S-Ena type endospore appendage [unclassified Bacillus (in: firmicutes)]PEC50646.1 hypothetical protein CON00_05330 [Bacillus sp. AFS096315]PFM76860.1 hypothetical protein COJ46_19335 [Bacillus sp. AFS077874]
MREEKHKKSDCDCEKKPIKKPLSPPKPKPTSPTTSPVRDCCPPCDEIEIICTKLCGNLFLDQDVHYLEIWKKELNVKTIVTVSVFNSATSTTFLRVTVYRFGQSSIVFKVPRGNTLSATVEGVTTISVAREEDGVTEGTFCLEICFPFSDKTFFFN